MVHWPSYLLHLFTEGKVVWQTKMSKKKAAGKVVILCNKDILYVSFVCMLLQINLSINIKD